MEQIAKHRLTRRVLALAMSFAVWFPERVTAQDQGTPTPASAPGRVGFAIQFTGVSELDKAALRTMMERRAQSIVARVNRIPATDAQDFWVQAKVAKRPDEDGNIGFDLRLVGRFQGRSLRWPELGRRCTFCTDGEFVEMFGEAFSALMDRPMPQAPAPVSPYDAASSKRTDHPPAKRQAQPKQVKLAAPSKALAAAAVKEPSPFTAPVKARAGSLRWWGWMGLGLSLAGSSSIVASLATMPRNVPLPDNPAKMYPARPDTATKIGLVVGGSCLVAGVALWVTDLVSQKRKKKSHKSPVAGVAWYF